MTDARDIVEDLRRHAFDDCGGFAKIVETHVAYEAAREIISLRKQLEDARDVALEQAARVAEEAPITGPTLSSWINANESPMGATRRHIATAIRALKGKS